MTIFSPVPGERSADCSVLTTAGVGRSLSVLCTLPQGGGDRGGRDTCGNVVKQVCDLGLHIPEKRKELRIQVLFRVLGF